MVDKYSENFLRVGDTYDWESYNDNYYGGDASIYGDSTELERGQPSIRHQCYRPVDNGGRS
jgi:hypothetical protein